jgi:hypothetical protein
LQRAIRSQELSDGAGAATGERVPSPWATSLQATCDCLSSHGVIDNVQRRHREDELDQSVDTDLFGELAQLVVVTRMLLDEGLVTEEQLASRVSAVQERFARAD